MPLAAASEAYVFVVSVRLAGEVEPFVCDSRDAALAVAAQLVSLHDRDAAAITSWLELSNYVSSPDNDLGVNVTTTRIWTVEYSAVEELDLASSPVPEGS